MTKQIGKTYNRYNEFEHAMKHIGIKLVPGYPRVSQDLNAIENVWALLKTRLRETLPRHLEPRDEFIARLKAAVRWLNWHQHDAMWQLSMNQKQRARDLLELEGARTQW